MVRYKFDILKELSAKGYTAPVLRSRKLISENTMGRLRHGEPVGMDTLNTICLLLRKQPGDIIEVIPTDEEKIKYF
jgi:putative transcriptional regulator